MSIWVRFKGDSRDWWDDESWEEDYGWPLISLDKMGEPVVPDRLCGTTHCVAGWAVALLHPDPERVRVRGLHWWAEAAALLGFNGNETDLFTRADLSRADIAARLRELGRKGKDYASLQVV